MIQAQPKRPGTRRFFMHYNKHTKKMTVHWKNSCIPVNDIVCYAPLESKWNKRQPQLVLRGWASDVCVKDNIAYIIK